MISRQPCVYIVLLSFNCVDYTVRALKSLSDLTYSNYRSVIVDNNSATGVVEVIREKFPHMKLLVNNKNLGFASGINRGIRYAMGKGADYVLILNNDVVVEPDLLTCLVDAMKPDVGASGPIIYSLEEPQRIWSVGFSQHPVLYEMRGGARGLMDSGQFTAPFEVDYLVGCAMLLNVSALKQVGLFDERYFFYYEDLDLSLRFRRQDYRLLTVPRAKVFHGIGVSSGKLSRFRSFHKARSSVIFFRTHARSMQIPAIMVFRALSAIRVSFRYILLRKFDLLSSYWKGIHEGLICER